MRVRRLELCKLDPELAREKKSGRLCALVLIVEINREETTCPQVERDEDVLN